MTDAPRTVTLPDGRTATVVPADEAGEFILTAAEGLIQHLDAQGLLTWRQVTAAGELARLYGIGGGTRPWNRGGGAERPEEVVEAARQEFVALLAHMPRHCRGPVVSEITSMCQSCNCSRDAVRVLSMGEWPDPMRYPDPLRLWREGLTALADHLKLAPETP